MIFVLLLHCYAMKLTQQLFPSLQNHTIALDDAAKDVIEIDEDKMEKNNKSKIA